MRGAWIAGGILVVAAGSYAFFPGAVRGTKSEEALAPGATVVVQRGPLRIELLENGTVKAKDSTPIQADIRGSAKILTLIDEGTEVKEGDVLMELDSTDLQKEIEQLELQEIQYESEYKTAVANLEIQKAENESSLAKATLAVQVAETGLRQFKEGDAEQQRRKLELDLEKNQSDLSQARKRYHDMEGLAKEGFTTPLQLEEQQSRVRSSEMAVEIAKIALDVFKKYKYPIDLQKKENDLEESRRALEREKQKTENLLEQRQAAVVQRKLQLKSTRDRLEEKRKDFANMTVRAPGPGLVLYGDPDRPWFRENLQVGQSIYGGNTIFTLPDLKILQVLVDVHEADIDKIQEGLPATVTFESRPGLVAKGKVTTVSNVARQDEPWRRNTEVREFRVEITLDEENLGVKAGVSAKCEILIEEIPDALIVPLQSTFESEGETYCFVVEDGRPRKRTIRVGKSSDSHVEVLEGLEEGESVLLYNPELFERGAAVAQEPAGMPGEKEAEGSSSGEGKGVRGARTRRGGAGRRPSGGRPSGGRRGP